MFKHILVSRYNESTKDGVIIVITIAKEYIVWNDRSRTEFSGNQKCINQKGNERVRGYTVLSLGYSNDVSGVWGCPGQVITTPRASFYAVNEKKGLFGWSKKKTGALDVIANDVSYFIGPFSDSDISIHANPNDNQVNEIRAHVYGSSYWFCTSSWSPFAFFGNVTFYGRNYTSCSL